MKISFVVQGLFEKSDSIGYDCIYQYLCAKKKFSNIIDDVRIYAEKFDLNRHPDIPIEGLDKFYQWCDNNPDGIVIYHYCGAWKEMDDFLLNRPTKSIVRWHNNTSPWFYFSKETYLEHTMEGFNNIIKIAKAPNLFFWVNSPFTQNQFIALGGQPSRSSVVFPASRYIGKTIEKEIKDKEFAPDGVINILFVGRVVQHKGHKSIIAVAERVHKVTGMPVIVRFAGREDDVKEDIAEYASHITDIETIFYGEVSEEELAHLYKISDVFICLSEHEGFGLPVFEAMRCNLPTIVWSTTALRELMADHPLGFYFYDLNMFAAAVIALQNKEVYQTILKVQEKILKLYSPEVISSQIQEGLTRFQKTTYDQILSSFPAYLLKDSYLAKAMASKMEVALSIPKLSIKTSPHDGGYNLFSRYDVEAFKIFLDLDKRLRFAPFENYENQGKYRIAPDEFHHHKGKKDKNILLFPRQHYENGHLIFGPYIRLLPGKYKVEFDILVFSQNIDKIIVDTTSSQRGLLMKKKFLIQNIKNELPYIIFDVHNSQEMFEFRVDFPKSFDGEVSFKGAILSQTK